MADSVCLSHSLEVEEHAAGDEEGDEAEGVAAHVDDLGVVGVAAGHAVHERGVAVLAVDLAGAVVVWFDDGVGNRRQSRWVKCKVVPQGYHGGLTSMYKI